MLILFWTLRDTGRAKPPGRSPAGRLRGKGACPRGSTRSHSVSASASYKIEIEKRLFCRVGRTGLLVQTQGPRKDVPLRYRVRHQREWYVLTCPGKL